MFRKSNNSATAGETNTAAATATAAPINAAPKKPVSPTIIASDVNLLGNLISEGVLDIDGRVDGTVKASHITLRTSGVIKGDVVGDIVHIYGEVKGVIKAKTVVLFASCRVEGIIMHESLTIEDGAFVDGKFKRTDKPASSNDDDMDNFEESAPLGLESEMKNLKLLDNLKLVTN